MSSGPPPLPDTGFHQALATPTVEEPIALEPITLEPAPESLPSAPGSPAPGETAPPPALESTGDHPAVLAPADPLTTTDPAAAQTEMPAVTPVPLPEPPTSVDAPEPAATASPKLVVVRGQRMDVQYPIFPGQNFIGRTDDKPVDIDLEDQEAQDRIWSSRQHAVVTLDNGKLTVEDLNSLNGTFVNRNRVHPGQVKELAANDVIQIGTVHLKVIVG